MNAGKVTTRIAMLGLGFLCFTLLLMMEVGLGRIFIYSQISAAVPLFAAACFTAFAHGPKQVLTALAFALVEPSHPDPIELERKALVLDTLGRSSRACGWIGFLLGGVAMAWNLSGATPKMIGCTIALDLLFLVYAYLFYVAICLPGRDSLRALAQERRANPLSS